jgi:KDO2-lipid IV(A) lauroyltransferase
VAENHLKKEMNLILAALFLFFAFFFFLIPFPLLYLISDLIRFLLQHVVGYRKKVIVSNLKSCFPDLSEKELNKLVGKVYKNLADVLVEGIKAFSMTKKQIKKRHFILNPELADRYIQQGKSAIALPSHFNNWEWGTLSPGQFINSPLVAFYKPLSNKYIDQFLRWSRSKFGTSLVSIYITALAFERHQGQPCIYVMAADQSPTNARKSYWVDFLGRDTAFLHGPEKYARMFDIPVFYVDVQRVKRGHYTLDLSLLADNPKDLPEGEITRRYAKRLEEAILKSPGSWLWSHKRWKLNKK